jgi:hypothetical protein
MMILFAVSFQLSALTYKIVDTGQSKFFDSSNEIEEPSAGSDYYGQDAQYPGNQASYTDNGDGTITDNVTGLMWTKTCDTDGDGDIDVDDKLSYTEALASASEVDVAGYTDWRVPTIKEQYSLMYFAGIDPSGYDGESGDLIPFVDTDYFDFNYGDESAGERLIDAQMVTTTTYVYTTMEGAETVFGVNFADGRIKGYGSGPMPGQSVDKQFYVYYVRGNTQYGINDFEDNADNTISDNATGLMWTKNDSGEGMTWQEALAWVQEKNSENYLGHNDWRLPDVKELHSIVDYTRSPDTTDSAAIDEVFNCTEITNEGDAVDYPFYWSGTTHENWSDVAGGFASYVSFGRALGWMEEPPMSGNHTLMDVHGAGAQRSDPKAGNPDDYPYGNGPQGDVIRIYNFVRMVRDFEPTTANDLGEVDQSLLKSINYPNPFNPTTTITFSNNGPASSKAELTLYNTKGQEIKKFTNLGKSGHVTWDGKDNDKQQVASGTYFYVYSDGNESVTNKMTLLK